MFVSAAGTEPPGELQVPPPPEPESAGQAVPDAGLQAGLIGRAGSRRSASTRPRPAAGHRADHEEWTYAVCQRRQQPKQPRYPPHYGQSRQRGELVHWKMKASECEL